MKSILLALVSCVCMGAAAFGAGQPDQDVIAAVEKHYSGLTNLAARVVQKNYYKSMDKTQKFDGQLWIEKPGRLRLDYSNGQVILVNGKDALFYSRKSAQVIKKTFTDFHHMNIPVAFLLGAGHIRDDFDILTPDPAKPRVLELVPKRTGASMKKMRLVADGSGRIADLTIIDKSGNTTELDFTDVREGIEIDKSLFSFQPPKGTEIIEQ